MQNRPLRPFEQGAHLHVLDWAHHTARARLQAAGAIQVKAAAKAVVKTPGRLELPSLAAAVHAELVSLYAVGHATVRSELDHQATGEPMPIGLSSLTDAVTLAVADPSSDHQSLLERARLTAAAVAHTISDAVHRGRLQGITDGKTLRSLGRDAGNAALGQAASHHAGGTINAGRHAAAQAAIAKGGRTGEIIGARYTSVLDKNSCPACIAADDGVLRSLADPGLVHPPNPNCAGGDRCRCILVYQLSNEITSTA